MQSYQEMTKEELCKEKESLEAAYKEWQKRGLSLNMARGKPSEWKFRIYDGQTGFCM